MVNILFAMFTLIITEDVNSKSIKSIMEKADSFEIYSLDPAKKSDKENKFHGWFILGSVVVTGEEQKKIIESFYKSIADSNGVSAKCFRPRHGIKVKKGQETIELLICFECYKVVILKNKSDTTETLTATAQKVFDEILKTHNIPLSEKPKE